MGDVNTSLIKTVGGKTIMLQHTVSTPRLYSRIQTVQGTRGIWKTAPKMDVINIGLVHFKV